MGTLTRNLLMNFKKSPLKHPPSGLENQNFPAKFVNIIWLPYCNYTTCVANLLSTFYIMETLHCVKSAQKRSFFWSVFSRIRTEYREILRISPYISVFSPNAAKYGPEKTPYLDTFHTVLALTHFMPLIFFLTTKIFTFLRIIFCKERRSRWLNVVWN